MERAYRVAAYVLVLAGGAYTVSAGIAFHGHLSLGALRFAGAGLGWVFLGLLNLSALACTSRRVVTLTLAANAVGLVYFVLLAVTAPGVPALVTALAALCCTIGSASRRAGRVM